MSLLQQIEGDLLEAMKSQQPLKRDVLRGLKSSIKNQQIEQGSELTDDEIEKVIAREVKRRKESITAFTQAGKPDLAKTEEEELNLLQKYLPEQVGQNELELAIDQIISELGDAANVGMVMGKLSAQFKGRADMGLASRLVSERLR